MNPEFCQTLCSEKKIKRFQRCLANKRMSGSYGGVSMTALRKEAIDLLEQIPEDKLYYIVQVMHDVKNLEAPDCDQEVEAAYQELESLRKKNIELDYDKELASYREKKYGIASSD